MIAPSDPYDRKVYFAQADCGGLIKIGFASDPVRRVKALQQHCPCLLRLLVVAPGGPRLEAELHRKFDRLRVRGEWFRPAPELLRLIEQFKADPDSSLRQRPRHGGQRSEP
jgi:hypothetical protein